MTNLSQTLGTALDGRYRIGRELGAGGMAVVFLAHDLKHDRDVALKVLRPELGLVLGAERFLSEIRVTANLQHPNILPLFDSGEAGGLLYYVMPYIEGETLRSRLEREQRLPVDDVVRIVSLIASALDFAHARHVIHRDLKPENILLQAGQPVIADFGIALAVSKAGGERLTATGLSMGTPSYMSPEQAAGSSTVDPRSDQYALAAVCYEMLSGAPPHVGPTVAALMARVLTEAPHSVRDARPAVPPALDAAVLRALAKDPADRFASCEAFAHAMTDALHTQTPAEPAAPGGAVSGASAAANARARRRALGPTIGALALLAILAAGAWWWRSRDTFSPPTVGRSSQLTDADGLEIHPAISPDGKLVAYAAGTSARMRIFTRPVAGGRTIPLSDDSTAVEHSPRWAPDGNSLLFLTRGGVSVAPVLGGTSQRVLAPVGGDSVLSADWSPDGTRIVYVRRDSIHIATRDGKPERSMAGRFDVHQCTWSPDARWIACVEGNRNSQFPGRSFGNTAPSALVLLSAEGGPVMPLTAPGTLSLHPEWAPDSRHLYYTASTEGPRDVYLLSLDERGAPRGEPLRITTGLGATTFSLAADGSRMTYAVYTSRANIFTLPLKASRVLHEDDATVLTSGKQIVEAIDVSRDGKWVLYDSDLRGNADIYRMPAAGGEPEQLTSESFAEFAPSLSPDGTMLAYHSFRNGTRDVEVRVLATGAVQRVTDTPSSESYPAWSPDGTTIAYWDQFGRGVHLVRRDANGAWARPSESVAAARVRAEWTRDGRALLINNNETKDLDLVDVITGARRVLVDSRALGEVLEEAQQGFDGPLVYFKSHDLSGRTSFWSVPLAGGTPRRLAQLLRPDRQSARVDLAVDPTRLLFTIESRQSDVYVAELKPR